jgi:hypothetical protein
MNRTFVAGLAVAAAMAGCDSGLPCPEAHFGTDIPVPGRGAEGPGNRGPARLTEGIGVYVSRARETASESKPVAGASIRVKVGWTKPSRQHRGRALWRNQTTRRREEVAAGDV